MTDTARRWIEWALGLEEAVAGEGTDWHLEAPGLWPLSVLLLAAVGIGILVITIYTREGTTRRGSKTLLVILRMAMFAVLVFMIAGTQVAIERTGLPHLPILIDTSASQGEVDRFPNGLPSVFEQQLRALELEPPHRLNLAKSMLLANDGALLDRLSKDYALKFYYVDEAVRRVAPALPETEDDSAPSPEDERKALLADIAAQEPLGEQSRLGSAVREVLNELRGVEPAAIVFFTDGVTTDGESIAQVARYSQQQGVPLVFVGLGTERARQDIQMGDVLVDDIVFVNDVIAFEVPITANGYEGRQVVLELRREDSPEVLARETVRLAADGQPQRARLNYRASKVGDYRFIVSIPFQEGETNPDNNFALRTVSVRDETARVLLVENLPRFEFRYLKALFERTPGIELSVVLHSADPAWAQNDRSALKPNVFPVSKDELNKYDTVIFGDVNPAFLSAAVQENLAAFVRDEGGGLVLMAGPLHMPLAYQGTPLESLFPIEIESTEVPGFDEAIPNDFRPRLTDFGLGSPLLQLADGNRSLEQIWSNLPGFFWTARVRQIQPAARPLVVHPDRVMTDGQPMPIMTLQYAGRGQVLFHATDETWRWHYQTDERYFARYWVQAVRTLARAKLLGEERQAELRADRQNYRRGESVRLEVRFPGDSGTPAAGRPVTVLVEQGDFQSRVNLDRQQGPEAVFSGTFSPTRDGNWTATMVAPLVEGTPPRAQFSVVAPPSEWERIALDRRQMDYAAKLTGGRLLTIDDAEDLLDALPEGRRVPVETRPPKPLWNQWWVVLTFLSLLIGEWLLRKRAGLV